MALESIDVAVFTRYACPAFAHLIYGLIDPRREGIAYVGRSKGPVLTRYFTHIADGLNIYDTGRTIWLRSILSAGFVPGLVIIERVAHETGLLAERESFWIAELKDRGEAWVEWLMGYPLGWTALPASATPSSRSARSKSSKPSKRLRTG